MIFKEISKHCLLLLSRFFGLDPVLSLSFKVVHSAAFEDYAAVLGGVEAGAGKASGFSDDAVALAEKLAKKGTPPIVWFSSDALEAKLGERLPRVYGAGDEPPDIDSGVAAHLCAAKLCHATGRNLQQWSTAIVLEPPSSGKAWEQLLGRHHRERQTADEVVFYVYQHTEAYRNALESAEEKN